MKTLNLTNPGFAEDKTLDSALRSTGGNTTLSGRFELVPSDRDTFVDADGNVYVYNPRTGNFEKVNP